MIKNSNLKTGQNNNHLPAIFAVDNKIGIKLDLRNCTLKILGPTGIDSKNNE